MQTYASIHKSHPSNAERPEKSPAATQCHTLQALVPPIPFMYCLYRLGSNFSKMMADTR